MAKTNPPTTTEAVSAEAGTTSKLQARLGPYAIKAGYTAVPDVLIRSHKQLGLSRLDLLVALMLLTYWRSVDDMPWPAKDTIATSLDVDPETVRRSVKKMEGLGYIKRVLRKSKQRDNLSNKYDLRGLAKAVDVLAKAELELRKQRAAEDKRRAATPKAAKLALVKGGKTEG
jgi:hypothetical protein